MPHAYGTAMHDDFGSSLVVPPQLAFHFISFIHLYVSQVCRSGEIHGRDRLPGHCLVPFPGFHVVRSMSNPKDHMDCLVDREEHLDRTWILCIGAAVVGLRPPGVDVYEYKLVVVLFEPEIFVVCLCLLGCRFLHASNSISCVRYSTWAKKKKMSRS